MTKTQTVVKGFKSLEFMSKSSSEQLQKKLSELGNQLPELPPIDTSKKLKPLKVSFEPIHPFLRTRDVNRLVKVLGYDQERYVAPFPVNASFTDLSKKVIEVPKFDSSRELEFHFKKLEQGDSNFTKLSPYRDQITVNQETYGKIDEFFGVDVKLTLEAASEFMTTHFLRSDGSQVGTAEKVVAIAHKYGSGDIESMRIVSFLVSAVCKSIDNPKTSAEIFCSFIEVLEKLEGKKLETERKSLRAQNEEHGSPRTDNKVKTKNREAERVDEEVRNADSEILKIVHELENDLYNKYNILTKVDKFPNIPQVLCVLFSKAECFHIARIYIQRLQNSGLIDTHIIAQYVLSCYSSYRFTGDRYGFFKNLIGIRNVIPEAISPSVACVLLHTSEHYDEISSILDLVDSSEQSSKIYNALELDLVLKIFEINDGKPDLINSAFKATLIGRLEANAELSEVSKNAIIQKSLSAGNFTLALKYLKKLSEPVSKEYRLFLRGKALKAEPVHSHIGLQIAPKEEFLKYL